jgi:hypothetical protein
VNDCLQVVLVGVGATAFVDLWSMVRTRFLGVPAPNFGLVGRWFAYFPRGRFRHDSIAASPAVRGELAIGWVAHYLIGVAFAALLVCLSGRAWLQQPTPGPALLVGVATVVFPFLLMQPGMGAGIAASRAPNPRAARLQSIVTHGIFGLGLYAAAVLIELFQPH